MLPHNPEIRRGMRTSYAPAEIESLRALLFERGALAFPALPNGLFSAALVNQSAAHTGYQAVWVRDNVHIAHSLAVNGESGKAAAAVLALADHFARQAVRFDAIVADPARAANPEVRPHVKFSGYPIGEVAEWPHAQNDALGYFVWIFSRMCRLGNLALDSNLIATLARFPRYFEAIQFWSDDDSGHWEEARKNSASSIGTVCAGMRELKALLDSDRGAALRPFVSGNLVEQLLEKGLARLDRILPAECIQDPPRQRRYDSALLFLVYPLDVVSQAMADQIVRDVSENLLGDYGIRRYLGDSFWSADYRRTLAPEDRTRDFSSDVASRDRFFKPGSEAQWCIFDPILSVVFGRRYQNSGSPEWLQLQTEHFNRSLSQITAAFRCPELWHWETAADGTAVLETSEATPLLWTQANLWLALTCMRESVKRAAGTGG